MFTLAYWYSVLVKLNHISKWLFWFTLVIVIFRYMVDYTKSKRDMMINVALGFLCVGSLVTYILTPSELPPNGIINTEQEKKDVVITPEMKEEASAPVTVELPPDFYNLDPRHPPASDPTFIPNKPVDGHPFDFERGMNGVGMGGGLEKQVTVNVDEITVPTPPPPIATPKPRLRVDTGNVAIPTGKVEGASIPVVVVPPTNNNNPNNPLPTKPDGAVDLSEIVKAGPKLEVPGTAKDTNNNNTEKPTEQSEGDSDPLSRARMLDD